MTRRSLYYSACLSLLKAATPYVWGGRTRLGLDCSGFPGLALYEASKGAQDLRGYNTDLFWTKLPRIEFDKMRVGDLILYWGPAPKDESDVSHAMVYAGEGVCFGQAYGGPKDVDPIASRKVGRVTQILPVTYRPDLAGFVQMPVTS